MGSFFSNPVDGSTKQELQDIIKGVVATFTAHYTKEYLLALVEKIKIDSKTKPSDYKLLVRPVRVVMLYNK